MTAGSDAAALAAHLDALNRRVEEAGPTPDAAARMRAITEAHEVACAALRRAEAEAEIDDGGPLSIEVR